MDENLKFKSENTVLYFSVLPTVTRFYLLKRLKELTNVSKFDETAMFLNNIINKLY